MQMNKSTEEKNHAESQSPDKELTRQAAEANIKSYIINVRVLTWAKIAVVVTIIGILVNIFLSSGSDKNGSGEDGIASGTTIKPGKNHASDSTLLSNNEELNSSIAQDIYTGMSSDHRIFDIYEKDGTTRLSIYGNLKREKPLFAGV